jgi:uncharacterized protein YyaL (SSP411 family)
VNRLVHETSPYLHQHADNPVDWFPWGDEAFEEARRRDVPVFLSIGYSACHWCHVMAHESFEDDELADVLNTGFVAVKVDREERPDVDAVYMAATLAMSGHGGWPMSVFLTPDARPFFAGTYFPPQDRSGLPGFRRLLEAITEAWRERRSEMESQADALAAAAAEQAVPDFGPRSAPEPVDVVGAAVDQLAARFDRRWGGFGPAPKFPQPALVELCLRRHRAGGEEEHGPGALEMVEHTLAAMASGGIHDHLGGGFCRYSTDETWTVPHFEKMLYDQAGLTRAYLHAWQLTGDGQWLQVVSDTVTYVLRDLAAPGGGLCSAEDADSEGEEGRFYLWTPEELARVLGPDAERAARYYGMEDGPNFEGRSILRLAPGQPLLRTSEVEGWRHALYEARGPRVRPGRDGKVLTEWNAMFCSALAEAAAAAAQPAWKQAAESLARFLLANLRDGSGRWMRSWQGGRARHLGYAADYAWLVDCFTRVAELTGEASWLAGAAETASELLRLFRPDDGPLRTTGEDAEALIVRPAEVLDDATPSATAVAATALLRLGALCGDAQLSGAGAELVDTLRPVIDRQPLAAAFGVAGAELVRRGVTEVVIPGSRPDLVSVVQRRYEPDVVLAWGERTGSPLWEDRAEGLAYVCTNRWCAPPAGSPGELEERLDGMRNPARPLLNDSAVRL